MLYFIFLFNKNIFTKAIKIKCTGCPPMHSVITKLRPLTVTIFIEPCYKTNPCSDVTTDSDIGNILHAAFFFLLLSLFLSFFPRFLFGGKAFLFSGFACNILCFYPF